MNTTIPRSTPETDAEIKTTDYLTGEPVVVADFARKLERERDETAKQLEAMRDELQKVCQQRDAWAMRCDKLGVAAMREAIKEAYQVLQAVPVEYDSRFFRASKWTENALAKLQPFIK